MEGFPGTLKLGPLRLHHSPSIPARPKSVTAHCRGENGLEEAISPTWGPQGHVLSTSACCYSEGVGRHSNPAKKMNLSSLGTPSLPGFFLFARGADFLFLDFMCLWRGTPTPVTLRASLFSPRLRVGVARLCSDSPPCLGILLSCRELVFCVHLATWDWGRGEMSRGRSILLHN